MDLPYFWLGEAAEDEELCLETFELDDDDIVFTPWIDPNDVID